MSKSKATSFVPKADLFRRVQELERENQALKVAAVNDDDDDDSISLQRRLSAYESNSDNGGVVDGSTDNDSTESEREDHANNDDDESAPVDIDDSLVVVDTTESDKQHRLALARYSHHLTMKRRMLREERTGVNALFFGLTGAGKTHLIYALCGAQRHEFPSKVNAESDTTEVQHHRLSSEYGLGFINGYDTYGTQDVRRISGEKLTDAQVHSQNVKDLQLLVQRMRGCSSAAAVIVYVLRCSTGVFTDANKSDLDTIVNVLYRDDNRGDLDRRIECSASLIVALIQSDPRTRASIQEQVRRVVGNAVQFITFEEPSDPYNKMSDDEWNQQVREQVVEMAAVIRRTALSNTAPLFIHRLNEMIPALSVHAELKRLVAELQALYNETGLAKWSAKVRVCVFDCSFVSLISYFVWLLHIVE
jgi:hypothetical protein